MQPKSSNQLNEPFFKQWAKPGPQVPGLVGADTIADSETLDAISGHFRLFQLRAGHRFSTDDILTAWYGTSWCPTASRVLDLGSGIGSVGMVAAWRLPGAKFVTIEAQAESVALAKKSARFNGLTDRYEIRQGDFREPAILADEAKFDLVLGSPPYFPPGSGVTGDHPQKIACRFEMRGDISDYCRTGARNLALGGMFACVFPFDQLKRVQDAAIASDLTVVRQRPIIFKEGESPLICLFIMMLSEHLPPAFRGRCWSEPPLIIRTAAGEIHPEYSAVKLSFGFPP